MHEIGHLIGLLHSNQNSVRYADTSGYMTKAVRDTDWPLRCFNGQNQNYLGWFEEHQKNFNPLRVADPVEVELAAFVDHNLTRTYQHVLVNLADKLYLQYNRAKSYNTGTGEMIDKVTIVTSPETESGGTELVGGLSEGDVFVKDDFAGSGRTLFIEACEKVESSNLSHEPDAMVISIAMDQMAACKSKNNSG